MNISVNDLKRFRKISSHVVGSGILPSSHAIKFGDGIIVRASAEAFVCMECSESTDEVLVFEDVLWELVDRAASGFINITSKGNKTTVSDGLYTVPAPKLAVKDYVTIPVPKGSKQPISVEFLHAIGGASEGAKVMGTPADLFMYVHIGNKSVCAGNGFMAIMFPIEEEYTIVLEKKSAHLLSKLNIVEYMESDNHYFFYDDGVIMGFTKHATGYFDGMRKMASGGDEISFSASRSDLLAFSDLSLSMSKDKGVVTISSGQIEMYDEGTEFNPKRELAGVAIDEPFSFRASNMKKAITPLNAETLDFYNGNGLYYIKSVDTSAVSIVGKIDKK